MVKLIKNVFFGGIKAQSVGPYKVYAGSTVKMRCLPLISFESGCICSFGLAHPVVTHNPESFLVVARESRKSVYLFRNTEEGQFVFGLRDDTVDRVGDNEVKMKSGTRFDLETGALNLADQMGADLLSFPNDQRPNVICRDESVVIDLRHEYDNVV
ncbi:hypothetical protein ACFL2R_03095 [Patescibacteria group bacterium]